MERFNFWYRWLFVLGIIIILFGVFMTLFNQSLLFRLFNDQIDPVFWGDEAISEAFIKFQGWVYGVLGATMAGWGVMLIFIIQYPFRQREKWAWIAIAASLGFWYLLDTALSLYFGVFFNAVFNTLLVFLVLPPLTATRKAIVA
jgi:hypothetical protein